ncbi:MAG: 2-iminoacetate synthase ThiH [Verrucomicrobiales bacterium]|jgi:2-iminoacetate synthase|nr:2-iminoacetate synthase ThiH [Verrucomicrobiales bacterium]
MAFIEQLETLDTRQSAALRRFEELLTDSVPLENLARRAALETRRHFGRTMRLFAPLYVSNECVNVCRYCGFSRDNAILRVTLSVEQVEAEARFLVAQGFRSLLIVAGEQPKFVSPHYLAECVKRLRQLAPSVSLEVAPLDTDEYRPIVSAGADGLIVFQETYDPALYARLHTAGPKKDFAWRLACPERAYAAGFRRLGLGALLGLGEWRREALALAAHVEYLLKHCWQAQITVSFPRLCPAAGEFQPLTRLDERDLTRLICALRVAFPQIGLVLSTRERPQFRDGIAPLGITLMSAGAHTEPGGYTGAGQGQLRVTRRGRPLPALPAGDATATPQFIIGDHRPTAEVVSRLKASGLDPVWKDWEYAFTGAPA